MNIPHFIHFTNNGHFGDFHFGAIKDNVVLNSFVHAWCTHKQNCHFGTHLHKILLRTQSGMEFIGYSICIYIYIYIHIYIYMSTLEDTT